MSKTRRGARWLGVATIASGSVLAGCEFDPTGVAALSVERTRFVVVDDADRLQAVHGRSCTSTLPGGRVALVPDTLPLPPWADAATVFLNGWHVAYTQKDHHVAGLGAALGNVQHAGSLLTWDATAVISDKKFNDLYRWCYHYTAIAWNRDVIDATPAYLAAADEIEIEKLTDLFAGFQDGNSTALKARFRRIDFRGPGRSAVLPMGFGFMWSKSDRRLLQVAYSVDAPSRFLEAGRRYVEGNAEMDASQANSSAITWVTRAIFKDNNLVRDYDVAELVSIVTGPDVDFLTPPGAILPSAKVSGFGTGCIDMPPGERVRDVVIENVRFAYAFPVLTNWNLRYFCKNQRVTEIGIRIDTLSYAPPQPEDGTLRYRIRSSLRDRDGQPGHIESHGVSILGFLPTARRAPDVRIMAPVAGAVLGPGETVRLVAEATAPGGGSLPDAGVRWFSDRDGLLATGSEVQAVLSAPDSCEGAFEHTVRVEATDDDGNRAVDEVVVTVVRIC